MNLPTNSVPASSFKMARAIALWSALIVVGSTGSIAIVKWALAAAQAPAATANTSPVTASTMAHSCAACHGTNGQLGDESFAPLAGMPSGQFVKTMIDFREGRRPATLMGHVAQGFSDEDLKSMSEFFAAQKGAQ